MGSDSGRQPVGQAPRPLGVLAAEGAPSPPAPLPRRVWAGRSHPVQSRVSRSQAGGGLGVQEAALGTGSRAPTRPRPHTPRPPHPHTPAPPHPAPLDPRAPQDEAQLPSPRQAVKRMETRDGVSRQLEYLLKM